MSPTLFKLLNHNKYDTNSLISGVIFLGDGSVHQIDVKYILNYWFYFFPDRDLINAFYLIPAKATFLQW